jgi:hypothetical protein
MSDLDDYLKEEFERLKREGLLDPEIISTPGISDEKIKEITTDWITKHKPLTEKHSGLMRQHATEMAVASTALSLHLSSAPLFMLLMGSSVMEVITTSYALGVKDGMEMERLNRVWGSEDTKASEDG